MVSVWAEADVCGECTIAVVEAYVVVCAVALSLAVESSIVSEWSVADGTVG